MKVIFKNLAMIKEAEIDDANLTLIVGDNSLGKTILLEAYALFINTMTDRMTSFVKKGFIRNIGFQKEGKSVNLSSILKGLRTKASSEFTITYDCGDETELTDFFITSKHTYLAILKEKVLMDLSSEVDIEVLHDLNRLLQVPVRVRFDTNDDLMNINLNFGGKKFKYVFRLEKEMLNNDDLLVKILEQRIKRAVNRAFYENYYQIESLLFFPSERNMYKANALIRSANFISDSFSVVEKDAEMRYSESLFVSEYLKYINRLDFVDEGFLRDEFGEELHEILCKSIGGEPLYEDGVISSISLEDKNLPSSLFSTKQNRLVPYFMLSSQLDFSKCIIIEEPEAHMSLKSMFELVEVIEKLVERKRVILTSHSDVFVSLLNNMIRKNQTVAKVYELIEKSGTVVLSEVQAGDFGYELSFMSEALKRLNKETREVFSSELGE